MNKKKSYKIVLLGDTTVGKTSIVCRYYYDKFIDSHETTIGASFFSKEINNINLHIWDVAGQERYKSLTPIYYRNSYAAFFVFDINSIFRMCILHSKTIQNTTYIHTYIHSRRQQTFHYNV